VLVLVLLAEVAVALFLLGVLLIACTVTMRHGDPTATYQVYAVRDKLIEASVFKGLGRNDPWLETFYENVNSVLLHSNLLSGPTRWSLAVAIGHYQASHPGKKLYPFPSDHRECPEALRALIPELRTALGHLVKNHMGIVLQLDARAREQQRIQREKARKLLQMMRDDNRCGCPI